MIDPIAIGLTKEYISKQEKKDEKNPTIWIIGAIDSIQKVQISSSLAEVKVENNETKVENSRLGFLNFDFEVVRFGLKGFKNFGHTEFKTQKRNLFNVEYDVVADDIIRKIPNKIIQELSEVIWSDNVVSEELSKN